MSHVHGPDCQHDAMPIGAHVSDPKKAPPFVQSTASFLLDAKKSGLKIRQGVFNGKRVNYFKGKNAIDALLKDSYKALMPANVAPLETREDACKIIHDLGRHGFILHVERGNPVSGKNSPRLLQLAGTQEVKEKGCYMWLWEGSQIKAYAGAMALVGAILTAVLFPLWPATLRLGVWYLSVLALGLLGGLFGIAIIRLILYVITMIALPRGIWIFPNLFEDVGVIESFIPFWAWDEPKKKKGPAVANQSSPPSVADAATIPNDSST